MKFVTFQPLRTISIPQVTYIKPEDTLQQLTVIQEADVLLFPEKWQLPILVDGLHKPIFPSYSSINLGHNKIDMTRALQAIIPDHVPYTEIRGNTDSQAEVILSLFPFPFVAKLARSSMGNGVFLIRSHQEFEAYRKCTDTLYIQEYLPSMKEARICYVGNDIVSSYWKIGEGGQFHHNIAKGGSLSFDAVPKECLDLVRRVAETLYINHAGFDVLIIDGTPYILEFNVLFGNQGLIKNGQRLEQVIYEYVKTTFSTPEPTSPFTGKRIS
ncbi:RimK family alpha-L-glutamate ligase [Pontibacillus salicampi]|uniref:RimK family alpha-L-glutamate ligase n=1 Tax=Pontibacillus salicampi TaxID=1449801 RepID=A0ABV6LIN7_9BACI